MKNGEKPYFPNILARSALRQMPFEYITFLQGRKLGFHDEYSSTFVVNKNKLEKSKQEFENN
jgi:hypothetical protein